MTKATARNVVKNWPQQRKDFVLSDVAMLMAMRANGDNRDLVKISAPTAFILEKCFHRGVDINPIEIAKLL